MKSHPAYLRELSERNPTIECLEEYRGATTKILHRCKKCGHEWLVIPTSLVSCKPKGCPHCAAVKAGRANKSYSTDSFSKKLLETNASIELIGEYESSHKKSLFRCKHCNHKWTAMPYSVLQGHGCPKCAKSGTSFMEQVFLRALRLCLGDSLVLERDKKAIGEELDIYIPSMKIAIEPGSWTLHKNRLWKDEQKHLLAKDLGIRLIFVYDMFPDADPKPFSTDCLTYSGDFNRDDHANLWNYVSKIFSLIGIHDEISHAERMQIEEDSYEAAKAQTHELFIKKMESIHPKIEVIEKYTNANRRILCECKACGRRWNAIPANLLAGDGCWDCARKAIGESQRIPYSTFEAKVQQINPDIAIKPESYKGTHSDVEIKCLKCGAEWTAQARTLIRSNNCGCNTCRKEERRIINEQNYLRKLKAEKPYISCLGKYETKETKIAHRCEICGHSWDTTPATVLASKYGCPNWKTHIK